MRLDRVAGSQDRRLDTSAPTKALARAAADAPPPNAANSAEVRPQPSLVAWLREANLFEGMASGERAPVAPVAPSTSAPSHVHLGLQRHAHLAQRARVTVPQETFEQVFHNNVRPLTEALRSAQPDASVWNATTWQLYGQAIGFKVARNLVREHMDGNFGPPPATDKTKAQVTRQLLGAGALDHGEATLARVYDMLATRVLIDRAGSEFRSSLSEGDRLTFARAVQSAFLDDPARKNIVALDPKTGLPHPEALRLLPEALARRVAAAVSPAMAGTADTGLKLTMGELFQAGGAPLLQRFLTAGGCDLDKPAAALHGETPRAFIGRRPGETEKDHQARLNGARVFNRLAQPLDDLLAQALSYGPGAGKQRDFILSLTDDGVTHTAAAIKTDSLTERYLRHGSGAVVDEFTRYHDLAWRLSHPERAFEDPFIGRGYGDTQASSAKIVANVVNVHRTRLLAGLTDKDYEQRMSAVLEDAPQGLGNVGVRRGVRKLCDNVPPSAELEARLGAIDLEGKEGEVLARLNRLRTEPALYAMQVKSPAFVVNGERFEVSAADGILKPSFVGATWLGYAAKQIDAQGKARDVLLRLPHGATYAIDDGRLTCKPFNQKRFDECSSRVLDAKFLKDSPAQLIPTHLHKEAALAFAVQPAEAAGASAVDALAAGQPLTKGNVDYLLDVYGWGLSQIDGERGRQFGVFMELGPENVRFERGALRHTYVDVCLQYQTRRERAASFISGHYGSLANWIQGSVAPIDQKSLEKMWSGVGNPPEVQQRLEVVTAALKDRMRADHPMYARIAKDAGPEAARRVRNELQQEVQQVLLWQAGRGEGPSPFAMSSSGQAVTERFAAEMNRTLAQRSTEHVTAARARLGPLTATEQKFLAKVLKTEPGFYHRVKETQLMRYVAAGQATPSVMAKTINAVEFGTVTPTSEDMLYGAQRYIFGTVGYWEGPENYGPVTLELDPEYVKNGVWASTSSGYMAFVDAEERLTGKAATHTYDTASPELLDAAQRTLAERTLAPSEFKEAIGLRFIEFLRGTKGSDAQLARLNEMTPSDFRLGLGKLSRDCHDTRINDRAQKVGILEGHVAMPVPLRAFTRALVDAEKLAPATRAALEAKGIPMAPHQDFTDA